MCRVADLAGLLLSSAGQCWIRLRGCCHLAVILLSSCCYLVILLHISQAVDLYVLERAFSSTHPNSEPLVRHPPVTPCVGRTEEVCAGAVGLRWMLVVVVVVVVVVFFWGWWWVGWREW